MKNDRLLNFTAGVTTVALALVLLPGLWREAGRVPGGGNGETVVAGEVVRPLEAEPEAALSSTLEVAAAPGEEFEVELPLDGDGGCRWELSGPLDPGLASPAGRETRESPGSPSGRVEAWRFEAVGPGETFVNLVRLRPGSPYPMGTVTLHLVVTGP